MKEIVHEEIGPLGVLKFVEMTMLKSLGKKYV